tara:strand:- start:12243 stop:12602 length:360 start_codon:yes stop_codon:yes gene_type:complete
MDRNFAANRASVTIKVSRYSPWCYRLGVYKGTNYVPTLLSKEFFTNPSLGWCTGRTYNTRDGILTFSVSYSNCGTPGDFRYNAIATTARFADFIEETEGERWLVNATVWTKEGNHDFSA